MAERTGNASMVSVISVSTEFENEDGITLETFGTTGTTSISNDTRRPWSPARTIDIEKDEITTTSTEETFRVEMIFQASFQACPS